MTLEVGDHVWYWNGRISLDQNVPRALWFPGSNPHDENDYRGHGKEIYNFVIYPSEIVRGRPHMRGYEGSFSWLDNNPGNITGRPGGGGPDFGQYPNKFNWHNFLIFPTWEAGYDAIAQLLRSPIYVNLSILEAFRKYAPESDGNNPVAYANAVAAAAQVPVSTRVGDLDDTQMMYMQNKITEVEGVIAGDSFPWDSDEIPVEIANELPTFIRQARPRRLSPRSGPFTIDVSAPIDPSDFTSGLGGPNQGHEGPHWYIQYGMDLGAREGTPVYAAFDGHITKFQPHKPALDSGKVYGAQIFMRSPNDLMGGFYTHLTDTPPGLGINSVVSRGDYLGRVYRFGGIPPHLHLALVEAIGGPSGHYVGVDLYRFFLQLEATDPDTVAAIQFWQDGSPPEPVWRLTRVGATFAPSLMAAAPPPQLLKTAS